MLLIETRGVFADKLKDPDFFLVPAVAEWSKDEIDLFFFFPPSAFGKSNAQKEWFL